MNQRILSYSSFLAIMVPPNLGGHLTDLLNANCGDKGPSSGLHITLLDPFFEPEHFEASTNEMRELLQNIEPFEISLDEYGHFSKKNGSILWVKPHSTPSSALDKLQKSLWGLYPMCDHITKISPKGYQPHVTLGKFNDRNKASAMASDLNANNTSPTKFLVKEIQILSKRPREPYQVRATIPLGRTVTLPHFESVPL
eukprot:TRINITY_DN6020_c0_g1_i1.p1 TRINITY_DN6020_c0_g1~~TRINITY_DN6020_c0_g1_i1.p1  ORF type:complete len:198 (-),score=24.36 TRINITY_DN6020_c0_g1_i1:33-626(-)